MEIDYTQVAVEVTKQLAKDVYNDAGHPAAQNVGGAMGTLTGFFNHVVLHPLKKLNIEYEQKAIAWQRDMEKKYNNIPEENRIEPQLNIVGPTLESMKYNIMDDDLAEMFSNLLVSDMDKTTQGLCTPSFVKTIEQLTPNDAKTYREIHRRFIRQQKLPLCRVQYVQKSDPSKGLPYDLVPLFYTDVTIHGLNEFSISKSIQNLQRLGLIDLIEDIRFYRDNSVYEKILASDGVIGVLKWVKDMSHEEYQAKLQSKGYIQINDFGRDFAKVCLRGQ